MNVLSLFDGMSCGRIALERIGANINTYYASEIDKHAIQVSAANYPDIIRLGDVIQWRDWNIDWSSIDLVTGGFPCQAWSLAGKQLGDKDERGMLFWVMLDVMKHAQQHNSEVKFLIENVKMKKEFEQYITTHTENALGYVHKILINSALVSAQNRNRYYWTNFLVTQPEDKGIVLADILEKGITDREKSHCLDANYFKGGNLKSYFEKHRRQLVFTSGAFRGRYNSEGKTEQKLELRYDGKTNSLTTVQKDNVVIRKKSKTVRVGGRGSKPGSKQEWDGVYLVNDKQLFYRKLTSLECERLQTVPDGYTNHVSNTQRYKMLGNGWTVDVIAHILRSQFS